MKIFKGKVISGLMFFSIFIGTSLSLNNYFLYTKHYEIIQNLRPPQMSAAALEQMEKRDVDRIESNNKLQNSLVDMHESLLKRAQFNSKLYLVLFALLAVSLYLLEKYILSKIQHNNTS